jgi:hypothetical protein
VINYKRSFFSAAALFLLSTVSTQASVVSFLTTSFTGTGPTTLSTGFSSYTGFSLSAGNTDTQSSGIQSSGFYVLPGSYNPSGHTLTVNISFSSPETEFGFDYEYNGDPVSISSVTLGNGDSLSTESLSGLSGFFGVSDPSGTPFTTATVNFYDPGASGIFLEDFTYANSPASSAPEPASGALMLVGGAAIAGVAARLFKKRKLEAA